LKIEIKRIFLKKVIVNTYTKKCIDEGIPAAIAHGKPMAKEK
jgi:hypothetical protein